MPIRASGSPMGTPGGANRRSQASASSNPPATAAPLSAAITGTGVSVTNSNRFRPGRLIGGRGRATPRPRPRGDPLDPVPPGPVHRRSERLSALVALADLLEVEAGAERRPGA